MTAIQCHIFEDPNKDPNPKFNNINQLNDENRTNRSDLNQFQTYCKRK